jgi:hypothetical protein
MRIVVCVLLIVHGLITAALSAGRFNTSGPGGPNPKLLDWWPTPFGKSWIFSLLGHQQSGIVEPVAGLLWLVAGAALIAAALGLFGFVVPTTYWRALAGAGALVALVLFVVYAHPYYAIGIGADIAILLVLLWAKWPSPQILGS